VDYSIWNPEIDPHIARRYSHATLADKESNREALLLALGLPFDPVAPVFGVVTRLAYQKGIELILEALPDVLARRAARFVLLGEGEARYADALRALETAFPDRVRFQNGHDEGLAHRIEAGADFFLMPSRYEPCGLNQMYSLRYGAVPVVRRTGGLADSVRPFVRPDGDGTGFVFDTFTSTALRAAMELAIETFGDPAALARVRRNGMTQDFSWDRQVAHYEAAYARAASRA
jgi:starch synthase